MLEIAVGLCLGYTYRQKYSPLRDGFILKGFLTLCFPDILNFTTIPSSFNAYAHIKSKLMDNRKSREDFFQCINKRNIYDRFGTDQTIRIMRAATDAFLLSFLSSQLPQRKRTAHLPKNRIHALAREAGRKEGHAFHAPLYEMPEEEDTFGESSCL